MLRTIFACLAITCVGAHRIKLEEEEVEQVKLQSKVGASCEDLETMLHDRVVAFRDALDADAGRARLMMRSYSVIRILRRARTCSWVVEGDSADIEQIRGVVQTLVAENPCAQAARAELEAGASAETSEIETRKLVGSISILLSDTCEITEPEMDTAADLEVEASEAEAALQDEIDQLVDAPESAAAALIQSGASTSGFMRRLGVVFLFLLLLLACTSTFAAVGIVFTFTILMLAADTASMHWRRFNGFLENAFTFGALTGVASCGYALYIELLA